MATILGNWQFELSLQITLVVIPVAVYFLILGLLNSSRRPHLLSSRTDFAMLLTALSPLLAVPVLDWLGANLMTVSLVVSLTAAAILLAAPRAQHGWVIYNVSREQALRAAERALDDAGLTWRYDDGTFELPGGASLTLSTFPLLRNVTLRLAGPPRRFDDFAEALARRLGRVSVEPSYAAVSFVLISTAMLVAPMVMLADRVPEMVRLLTDLAP